MLPQPLMAHPDVRQHSMPTPRRFVTIGILYFLIPSKLDRVRKNKHVGG